MLFQQLHKFCSVTVNCSSGCMFRVVLLPECNHQPHAQSFCITGFPQCFLCILLHLSSLTPMFTQVSFLKKLISRTRCCHNLFLQLIWFIQGFSCLPYITFQKFLKKFILCHLLPSSCLISRKYRRILFQIYLNVIILKTIVTEVLLYCCDYELKL